MVTALALLLVATDPVRWPTIADLECAPAARAAEHSARTSSATWVPATREEARQYLAAVRWRACAVDLSAKLVDTRADLAARAKAPPIVVSPPVDSTGVSLPLAIGIGAGGLTLGALVGLVVGIALAR